LGKLSGFGTWGRNRVPVKFGGGPFLNTGRAKGERQCKAKGGKAEITEKKGGRRVASFVDR